MNARVVDVARYMMETPRIEQERAGKIRTFTGKLVNPIRLEPGDIDILDIAHHLSNICRYTGAVPRHYSVAQHSVLVAGYFTDPTERLAGLLHDASEAYINDLSSPMKKAPEFAFYRELEEKIERLIFSVFGLDIELMKKAKWADDLVFQREVQSFWGDGYKMGATKIVPVAPVVAEARFLSEFYNFRPKSA